MHTGDSAEDGIRCQVTHLTSKIGIRIGNVAEGGLSAAKLYLHIGLQNTRFGRYGQYGILEISLD